MNERTNTHLYKNISLILYSRKGWCWLCVRDELETGTDCYILTQVLLTIAALLSHLGWGCSTLGHWGPKTPCRWLSLRHLVPNWLKPSECWLYYCLTSTSFRFFSAYLHWCISWLTARSRVNMLHKYKHAGGLCCSGTNDFISFWLRLFDTRRETQFLKVSRNHTRLTILSDPTKARCILWCLRSLSQGIRKT